MEVVEFQMPGVTFDLKDKDFARKSVRANLTSREITHQPQACNMLIESIFFGCSAWIEKETTSLAQKKNKVPNITKGNITEQTLLKFILKYFEDETEGLINQKVEILHWASFNSLRKRSTVVMRFKQSNEDDQTDL